MLTSEGFSTGRHSVTQDQECLYDESVISTEQKLYGPTLCLIVFNSVTGPF
jgi:hypothetical protein